LLELLQPAIAYGAPKATLGMDESSEVFATVQAQMLGPADWETGGCLAFPKTR